MDIAVELSNRVNHIKEHPETVAHDVANAISMLDASKIARKNGDAAFADHAIIKARELLCRVLNLTI